MKAEKLHMPIALSQSLKNINTHIFKKSSSLRSLSNEINILAGKKQKSLNADSVYYDDKKMNTDEVKPSTTKLQLQLDRRSFYDNHKWIDEIQEVDVEEEEEDDEDCRVPQVTMNHDSSYLLANNEEIEEEENLEDYEDTLSLKAQMNFKSPDKTIQMENSEKVERDAFDDLIDLSHRVSKQDMMLKKTEESLKNANEEKLSEEASHLKSCDSISHTNNSSTYTNGKDCMTSSLPPLPYSFVRLEKSKTKNASNSNLTPTSSPRPSTTRLIIPMNQNKISTSNTQLDDSTSSTKSASTNYQFSNEIYSTQTELNNNNNTIYVSQSQKVLNRISPAISNSPIHPIVEKQSDVKPTLNRSNSYGYSAGYKEDHSRKTPKMPKTNEANKEWDQISKIFQSLETMLNEVCETTYKSVEVVPNQNIYTKTMLNNNSHLNESSPTHHFSQHHLQSHQMQHMDSSTSPSSLSSCSSPTSSFSNKSTPPKFHDEKLTNKIDSSTSNDQMSTIDDDNIVNDEILLRNPKYFQHVEVGNFLKRIDLLKYEFKFITNGYDHLNFMNNIITLQDLVQIGIENYDDIFKILKEIKYLPSAIKKISDKYKIFNSIEEWLDFLNLSEYLVNFRVNNINSMKRVLSLWEIELTTVLQIPFIGHRRRLMASIEAILNPSIGKRLVDKNIEQEILQKSVKNLDNELNFSSASSSSSNSFTSQNNPLNKNSTMTKLTTKQNEENQLYNKNIVLSTPSLLTSSPFNKSVTFNEEKKASPSQQYHPKLSNFIAKSDIKLNESSTNKTSKLSQLTQLKNFLKSSPRLNRTNFSSLTRDNSKKKKPEFGTIPKKLDVPVDGKNKTDRNIKLPLPNSQSDNNSFSYTNQGSNICPKKVWNNDPQTLIRGGSYNFSVQYLGSSALTKIQTNQDPVKYTIDRLKNSTRNTPYASPQVEIGISINGVQMLHSKTKEILWNHDIKHINNVCQDQDDLNYFAFSTQTDQASHYYCHVFSCKDKDLSTQIILTIGQAFDVAYELFCKNNVV